MGEVVKLNPDLLASTPVDDYGQSEEPPPADECAKDGFPCFVGAWTPDAHWRCGTSACGREALRSTSEGGGK